MKKICLINFPSVVDFHDYYFEAFDPLAYFPKNSHWSLSDLIVSGLNGYDHRRALITSVAGVDRLYRERNVHYMRMVGDFVDRFRDFDLIIMGTNNIIHPEVLAKELKKPVKILGFVDDPISTYLRGIPNLWAFDGAFFISPGYIDNQLFEDAIRRWSSKSTIWWPLVPSPFSRPGTPDEKFFRQRSFDLAYVGNPYGPKINRLIRLKRHFGDRMRIHGRWPFKGYLGFVRGLLGKPVYPHRVISLAPEERTHLYWQTKIGFNMHFSEQPCETGNVRMYETPAHGMLMVCDKAAANAHARIFNPDTEAVYYASVDEAIDLVEYYLTHDEERVRIAQAGYMRYWQDYEWESNMKKLFDWAASIRNQRSQGFSHP